MISTMNFFKAYCRIETLLDKIAISEKDAVYINVNAIVWINKSRLVDNLGNTYHRIGLIDDRGRVDKVYINEDTFLELITVKEV